MATRDGRSVGAAASHAVDVGKVLVLLPVYVLALTVGTVCSWIANAVRTLLADDSLEHRPHRADR